MIVELRCNPLELPQVDPLKAVIAARDRIINWFEASFDPEDGAYFSADDDRVTLRVPGKKTLLVDFAGIREAIFQLRTFHADVVTESLGVRRVRSLYQLFIDGNLHLSDADPPHVDTSSACIMRYTEGGTHFTGVYKGTVKVPVSDDYSLMPVRGPMRKNSLNLGLLQIQDSAPMKDLEVIHVEPWAPVVCSALRDAHRRMVLPETAIKTRMVGSVSTDYR